MSYFRYPQYFGIQDHTVGGAEPFNVRVYHPTDDDVITGAPLPAGPHPLVVFAHGDRSGVPSGRLCPNDQTNDHRRWTLVLGALARSGFVVAAPAMKRTPAESVPRLAATVGWMRTEWSGRGTILLPLELEVSPNVGASTPGRVTEHEAAVEVAAHDGPAHVARTNVPPVTLLGRPTALALVGHSWGARACALLAANGGVQALVAIAGSWDHSASIDALSSARIPTFMMAGNEDGESYSYLAGVWSSFLAPKYQAAFQGVGHWDWFGRSGAIRRCDGQQPQWRDTGHVAGELIAGFLTRHVAGLQFDPPHLVNIPLLRPWLSPWYGGGAIRVRWDAPNQQFPPLPSTGDGSLGLWMGSTPW